MLAVARAACKKGDKAFTAAGTPAIFSYYARTKCISAEAMQDVARSWACRRRTRRRARGATCTSPRQLDRARLLPMYEALHARTRAADNETIILYALLAQAGRAGAGSGE